MQRPGQRQAPILDGLAQPDIHSHQVVEVELLQKTQMGNNEKNGYRIGNWHYRHISRVYVLFYTAGFSRKLPGSHRSRIPDS